MKSSNTNESFSIYDIFKMIMEIGSFRISLLFDWWENTLKVWKYFFFSLQLRNLWITCLSTPSSFIKVEIVYVELYEFSICCSSLKRKVFYFLTACMFMTWNSSKIWLHFSLLISFSNLFQLLSCGIQYTLTFKHTTLRT